jgi:hypothetical protein
MKLNELSWDYFAALRLSVSMIDWFLGRWPRLLHCAPAAL